MQHLIRLPEVQKRTGLKRSSIYELTSAGEFPKPVKINRRAVAWVESEVSDWVQRKIESRDLAGSVGA